MKLETTKHEVAQIVFLSKVPHRSTRNWRNIGEIDENLGGYLEWILPRTATVSEIMVYDNNVENFQIQWIFGPNADFQIQIH